MRQKHHLSLAANITAVVVIASCVALAVFSTASIALNRSRSINELDARLSMLADIIGQNSTAALDFNDKEAAASVLQALTNESHIVSGCLYDTSGVLFAAYRRDSSDHDVCSKTFSGTTNPRGRFHSAARPAIHGHERVGTICLTSDMGDIADQEKRLKAISLFLALISLGIAGTSGLILQRKVSKPIAALVSAMHKVTSEESFDARVDVSGSREIAELASGFNSMLIELERRNRLETLAEARLQRQARTDSLTGLPNRRLFTECLSSAVSAARRTRQILGLIYIDLDGFKLVNDSLGHTIGDILLYQVAARLQSRVRHSDTLARIGGDEFAVILNSLAAEENAGLAAASFLECMTEPFQIEGHEITIGASIGISTFNDEHDNGIDLLRQADSAMYSAKRSGRNQVAYFTEELGKMAHERLTLENQLRGAIDRGEIHVHYQPELDLASGTIARFEALARWRHPQLGDISPSRFIPVAEESGLIHVLGSYVMEQACQEAMKWQKLSATPVQVAVNVSPIQFNSDSIVHEIARTIERTGMKPHLLQIELTESVMMGSLQRSLEKMRSLRDLGVSLALDDFGTGYSCLSYLQELPFASIKLDRSFVSKLTSGLDSNLMIRSMVDLAHSMDMRVIAEGVEENRQLEVLKALGVDEVQGFLLGRPVSNASRVLEGAREHPSATPECTLTPLFT